MTIKDMETKTGLTAKSIRYYETKGLLNVERQEGNNYREYTEDNLKELKRIKLYRYLGFSVEEIKELLVADVKAVEEKFSSKQEELANLTEEAKTKSEMLQNLAKDLKNGNQDIDSYLEEIDFWENDDAEDLRTTIRDMNLPTLKATIWWTVVSAAAVAKLFVNIARGIYKDLWLFALIALLWTVWGTVQWSGYLRARKYAKARMKTKSKEEIKLQVPLAILFLVLAIGGAFGVLFLTERVLLPEDYLFFVNSDFAMYAMLGTSMLFAYVVIGVLQYKKEKGSLHKKSVWMLAGAILVWVINLYCLLTSMTVIMEDKIIRHTPFSPFGEEYSYSDVTKVEARFGTSAFSFSNHKRKGQFYYKITLDGDEILITTPSANEEIERYEDSYLELEEFDQKLVSLGVEKESSPDGWDYCDLDKQFVDRFLRIINNK